MSSSVWEGLNQNLLATIFVCDKEGAPKGGSVSAPLLESNLDIALNWASPFEDTGIQSKMPSLFSLNKASSREDASTAPETNSFKRKPFQVKFIPVKLRYHYI